MIYAITLQKGPDWAIHQHAQTGNTNVAQSQHYVYRVTFNHQIMHQMRDQINIGNPPKLRFTLPDSATHERTIIVTNYQFWWKKDQGTEKGRADVVFIISTIGEGSINDLNNNDTKLAILLGR